MSGPAVDLAAYERRGFIEPIPLLDPALRRRVLAEVGTTRSDPHEWNKSYGITTPLMYEVATTPAILDLVTSLIGPDVLLWGASIVQRKPGQRHGWHSDHETDCDEGRSVSVWIGLSGTRQGGAIQMIAGSHRFGESVRDVAGDERASTSAMLEAARTRDPDAELCSPVAHDGDAIAFDGRMWHASQNRSLRTTRRALLLQYARPDTPIRSAEQFRPPCVMVHGADVAGVNVVVDPPQVTTAGTGGSDDTELWPSWTRRVTLPVQVDPDSGIGSIPLFRGTVPSVSDFGVHVTSLRGGVMPHPPHAHAHEEVVVALDGAIDIVGTNECHRLSAPSIAYLPPGYKHSIRSSDEVSSTYLIARWRNLRKRAPKRALSVARRALGECDGATEISSARLLEGPTPYLRRLRVHETTVPVDCSYEAHADPYDILLVMLRGVVETVGRTLRQGDVAFYAAGEMHGLRNRGDVPARYVIVELEGASNTPRTFPRLTPSRVLRGGLNRGRRQARRLWWALRRGED